MERSGIKIFFLQCEMSMLRKLSLGILMPGHIMSEYVLVFAEYVWILLFIIYAENNMILNLIPPPQYVT